MRKPMRRMAPRAAPGEGRRQPAAHAGALERLIPPALAARWAVEAANTLRLTRPEMCVATGASGAQIALSLGISVYIAGLIWLAPVTAALALATLGAVFFTAVIILRTAAALTPPAWAPRRRLKDAELPGITVIVALYREERVAAGLVRAIQALNYPANKLDVKLAVEADDAGTLAALRATSLDARFEIVPVPPSSPRTKPKALNYALRFARGEIVSIYDAEDRPHPDQLRVAAEAFVAGGARLACVQAPLNWYNRRRNWLTRQFALEYAANFNALLPLYARMGWPLPLGGTSNHVRLSALKAAGGWDAYNVTEDADLGFRLAALGWRLAVIAPPTLEEAPARLPGWLGQRSRWLKGYMQTWGVHMRMLGCLRHGAGAGGVVSLQLTLGAALASAALHALSVAGCAILMMLNPAAAWPALILLAAGYASAMACAAAGARRAGFRGRAGDLFSMPAYWLLQTPALGKALRELFLDPYFWDKTEHGLCPEDGAGPDASRPDPYAGADGDVRRVVRPRLANDGARA